MLRSESCSYFFLGPVALTPKVSIKWCSISWITVAFLIYSLSSLRGASISFVRH